jgi:hypothetical protein
MRRLRRQIRLASRMTRQTRLWLTDPYGTSKRFGDATIAIESFRLANPLHGETAPLIVFLVS